MSSQLHNLQTLLRPLNLLSQLKLPMPLALISVDDEISNQPWVLVFLLKFALSLSHSLLAISLLLSRSRSYQSRGSVGLSPAVGAAIRSAGAVVGSGVGGSS